MEKITSFTVDHIRLVPGVYVSRKDLVGDTVVTTFDIRITSPNDEPVMNTAELHAMEHLAATFLRNHPVFGPKTLYFGPMGCRTGCYLLLIGDYESKDVIGLLTETFEFIRDFEGEIPGACASSSCSTVPFPAPDGPVKTYSLPLRIFILLAVPA